MKAIAGLCLLALAGCVRPEVVARSHGNAIVRHLPQTPAQEVLDLGGSACAPRVAYVQSTALDDIMTGAVRTTFECRDAVIGFARTTETAR